MSSSTRSKLKLFIRYALEETTNDFVIRLQKDLKDRGYQVSLDKVDIVAGDNIQHELAQKMHETDGIITVYSDRFPSSQWCDKEVEMAQMLKKQFFPIRRVKEGYSDNLDMVMGSIKWIDFINDSEYQNSLKDLIKEIEKK